MTETELDLSDPFVRRYIGAVRRIRDVIAAAPGDPYPPDQIGLGIDLTRADLRGFADLLVAKGVATTDEIMEALATAAEREADGAEDRSRPVAGGDPRTTITTHRKGSSE